MFSKTDFLTGKTVHGKKRKVEILDTENISTISGKGNLKTWLKKKLISYVTDEIIKTQKHAQGDLFFKFNLNTE